MDVGSGDLRYIGPGLNPAWSPDGRIVFNTNIWAPYEGGIGVMNSDGSGTRLLIDHSFATESGLNPAPGYGTDALLEPTWSPDGGTVAFRLYAGYMGGSYLYLMDADGSDPRSVGWTGGEKPSWSPDGSTIAVVGHRTITTFDVVSKVRSSLSVELPRPWLVGGGDGGPDWSPDGSQLLFGAYHPTGSRRRIFVLSLETGEARSFIPDATNPVLWDYDDYGATWSRAAR
jgi:Tol biopolymer transport system component